MDRQYLQDKLLEKFKEDVFISVAEAIDFMKQFLGENCAWTVRTLLSSMARKDLIERTKRAQYKYIDPKGDKLNVMGLPLWAIRASGCPVYRFQKRDRYDKD